jgi:hypothetical protein
LVVVTTALLESAWKAANRYGWTAADPYLTLIAYFNTIRDLGGFIALMADDVPARMAGVAERMAAPKRPLSKHLEELTSRISAAEVPERLRILEAPFSDKSSECDVMACTNMISVGVDIQRPCLILVYGQHKTNST